MRDIEKRVDESIGRTRRTMRAVALAGLGNPSDILEKEINKNRTAIRSEPVSFGKKCDKKNTVRYFGSCRRISRIQTQLLQSATVKKKREKNPIKNQNWPSILLLYSKHYGD